MDDRKDKGTKKTIADELFEDNFFKPPIDEVIGKAEPEKPGAAAKTKGPEEKEESLLFDEFLKSPLEVTPDEGPGLTVEEAPVRIPTPAQDVRPPGAAPRSAMVIKTVEEPTGNRKGMLMGIVIGVASVALLAAGYMFFSRGSGSTRHRTGAKGSQTIVMKHGSPEPRPSAAAQSVPPPSQSKAATVPAPPAAPETAPAAQEQTPKPAPTAQVAANIPPAPKPRPVKPVHVAAKQFEVMLDTIRTKAALQDAQRIGGRMDHALKFDVKKNTTSSVTYSLVVDKVYSSEGEATADNLKLMVANVSNASIVKEDGGYRILIGKYRSKAAAVRDKKNIEAAGLKGLIKETATKTITYNVKVYPFRSSHDANVYRSKVRRFAARTTSSELK